jgi:8-oxo-dGTP pyrophosphatase MutT (NUDIX family)/NTP pyrophosphatase (non-canonical NTP hydrolase)
MSPIAEARIRALALCVFRSGDRILVGEAHDPVKQQRFYRPLGGGIDPGEHGRQTIAREIREELGADVANVRYLGTVENVFTYAGKAGHEIVLVYDADFVDRSLYGRDEIAIYQQETDRHERAVWKTLDELRGGPDPLYPTGVLDLLQPMPYSALPAYQQRVADFVDAAGLRAGVEARTLDLVSEVGEVAKEVLKGSAYGDAPFDPPSTWADELADAFFSLACLANATNVNLDHALEGALAKYRERLIKRGDAGSGR